MYSKLMVWFINSFIATCTNWFKREHFSVLWDSETMGQYRNFYTHLLHAVLCSVTINFKWISQQPKNLQAAAHFKNHLGRAGPGQHSLLLHKPEFSLNVFCNTLQLGQVLWTEHRRLIRSIALRICQKAYSDPAFWTPQVTLPVMFTKANTLTTLIYTLVDQEKISAKLHWGESLNI